MLLYARKLCDAIQITIEKNDLFFPSNVAFRSIIVYKETSLSPHPGFKDQHKKLSSSPFIGSSRV